MRYVRNREGIGSGGKTLKATKKDTWQGRINPLCVLEIPAIKFVRLH